MAHITHKYDTTDYNIPSFLKKYIVPQNYERYSSEQHSTWRYILRQLKDFLSTHAHSSYLKGLEQTGITINTIPHITDMDKKLQQLGWRAVPVSGFIPPAVFMEFQAHNILPIASDIRTVQHISYTPAPDIVHEAAGHAPFLVHPVFNAFLKEYAKVIKLAITDKKDFEQYMAIRKLSDLKEHPQSTLQQIQLAEQHLNQINAEIKTPSEASLLSRFIWWTSEYGLIGDLKNQKIYGAGLLSSIGEALQCLSPKVKKIPLTSDCVHYPYDITNYQPQLFVTPDFETLHTVLDTLKKQCAFYVGGNYGLEKAKKSQTTCTIELNTGLQISGLVDYFVAHKKQTDFIKLTGACQLSYQNCQLKDHGRSTHSQGFSSPLGVLKNQHTPLSRLSVSEIKHRFIKNTKHIQLEFASGWRVQGEWKKAIQQNKKVLLLQLQNCSVKRGDTIYFKPEWGDFDLAVGEQVMSVFGGPADRVAFGALDDFCVERTAKAKISLSQKKSFAFYQKIADIRKATHKKKDKNQQVFETLMKTYNKQFTHLWLAGVELLELAYFFNKPQKEKEELKNHLLPASDLSDDKRPFIRNAIQLIEKEHLKKHT